MSELGVVGGGSGHGSSVMKWIYTLLCLSFETFAVDFVVVVVFFLNGGKD